MTLHSIYKILAALCVVARAFSVSMKKFAKKLLGLINQNQASEKAKNVCIKVKKIEKRCLTQVFGKLYTT